MQNVVIVEHSTLFREMISNMINDMENFHVLEAFDNEAKAIQFLEISNIPSLCIIGTYLSKEDRIAFAKQLKAMQPLMKVVLVASDKDDDAIEAFPSTNLDGYLVADMGLGDFQSIIRLVMDGMFVAPQTMIQQYVSKLHYIATHEDRDQLKHLLMLEDVELNIDIEEIVLQKSIFTDREFQIFRLLRKGWSNKMIANEINLKEGTVKNYVSIIYKKLEIKNRDELMQLESANV